MPPGGTGSADGPAGARYAMELKMSKESRFLSRILRHAPETIELELDAQGWAPVDELLRRLKRAGRQMTRAGLLEIVATNDKKRFTLSPDGCRIRAAQGHSATLNHGLEPLMPPEVLYHGTARSHLDSIFRQGLQPGRRRQVHLSVDRETAERVGTRHGKPTVLRVEAGRMHADGHVFHRADNRVWLVGRGNGPV
jgi:putative RNA 2'-phosphotransferase